MKVLSPLFLFFVPATGYRPVQFPCRAHFQCETGYCNATRRCDGLRPVGAACDVNEACESARCSDGFCQTKYEVGSGPCFQHEDCLNGWCNATASICEELKPRQASCVNDFECNSGRCTANPRRCEFVIYEGAICGKDNDCFGDRCKTVSEGGDNRCYPRKWNNEQCNHNSDCLSLRCETQNCTEPVWLGMPCDEPSDCYSLFCNIDKGVCVATYEEADTNAIEPETAQISGSEAEQFASGGGTLISNENGDTVFVGEGSGAVEGTFMRMGIAALIGLIGAGAAMWI